MGIFTCCFPNKAKTNNSDNENCNSGKKEININSNDLNNPPIPSKGKKKPMVNIKLAPRRSEILQHPRRAVGEVMTEMTEPHSPSTINSLRESLKSPISRQSSPQNEKNIQKIQIIQNDANHNVANIDENSNSNINIGSNSSFPSHPHHSNSLKPIFTQDTQAELKKLLAQRAIKIQEQSTL